MFGGFWEIQIYVAEMLLGKDHGQHLEGDGHQDSGMRSGLLCCVYVCACVGGAGDDGGDFSTC